MLIGTLSCRENIKYKYSLKKSEKQLQYPIDGNTQLNIRAFFPYEDENGRKYITFQSPNNNDILFYDMDYEKYLFKISPEIEGKNGVGKFLGYYIHDLNNIYITTPGVSKLVLIDKNATIKEKIAYSQSADETNLYPFCAMSFVYKPIIEIGDNMYTISECNRMEKKNPVSATLNTKTKLIHTLPFSYPHFPNSENKSKAYGVETNFSRCYDGKQFIYSFHFDEYIYCIDQSRFHS